MTTLQKHRAELLDGGESSALKPGLQEGQDYALVPMQVFELLRGWFGGNAAIERFVIEEGEKAKLLRVEVYLLKLRVMVYVLFFLAFFVEP